MNNQEMMATIQKLAAQPRLVSARRQRAAMTPTEQLQHLQALGAPAAGPDVSYNLMEQVGPPVPLKARVAPGAGPAAQSFAQGARNEFLNDPMMIGALAEKRHVKGMQSAYDSWLRNKFGNDRFVADFVEGAQRNPRLGHVQHYAEQAEQKLASVGVSALDVAHMVGSLKALDESGFTKKEAAEYLGVVENAIDDVLAVVSR